jgi:GNAT superfamily N-acetyltransferase
MIRQRVPDDLGACVRALGAVHAADRYPLNWPRDPRRWLTPEGTLAAWVAVDAAGVAGHVLVTAPGRVGRLFVAPAYRGRGIAGELLTPVREWARSRGLDLVLDVVDDGRGAAVALYERTGWGYTGTSRADWTGPDGAPVRLRHYSLRCPA